MNNNEFHFDDERGNNFNITVNHFHMTPQNPMGNLLNTMTQMAMVNSIMNQNLLSEPKNELLEAAPIHRHVIAAIEDDSTKIQYEIKDEPIYEVRFKNMRDIPDSIIVDVVLDKEIDLDKFTKDYRAISDSIKYKLSTISEKTDNFIFTIDLQNIGKISCMKISTNYYKRLLEKFGQGKDSVFFSQSVAEKLQVPFAEILNEIDFIIDLEILVSNRYDSLNSKYHIKKEC